MNVVTNKNNKPDMEKRRIALYIAIILICVLAILISAYVLVFKNHASLTPTQHIPASEEEYLKMEEGFEKIFTNEIINQTSSNILITNKDFKIYNLEKHNYDLNQLAEALSKKELGISRDEMMDVLKVVLLTSGMIPFNHALEVVNKLYD